MQVVLTLDFRDLDTVQPLDGSSTNLAGNNEPERKAVVRLKTEILVSQPKASGLHRNLREPIHRPRQHHAKLGISSPTQQLTIKKSTPLDAEIKASVDKLALFHTGHSGADRILRK